MQINFRQYKSTDSEIVTSYIHKLYEEDPGHKVMSSQKISTTLNFLTKNPDRGKIMIIEDENEIIGYAILINFWSNEFGGNIVIIDELFLIENYRSKGIGTKFIKYLADNSGDSVALQLEVTPNNIKARNLYESIGFKKHKNTTFDLELDRKTDFQT